MFCENRGTGASCIYPLLAVARNNWNFVATGTPHLTLNTEDTHTPPNITYTEIDDVSLQWAQKNIALNHWEHKIELRKPPPNTILLHVIQPGEQYSLLLSSPSLLLFFISFISSSSLLLFFFIFFMRLRFSCCLLSTGLIFACVIRPSLQIRVRKR